MAIYDNNGSSSVEIGKIYDNNGSSSTQIGKIYDYNGSSNSLIYTASVNCTNMLGTNSNYQLGMTRALDIGWTQSYSDKWHTDASGTTASRSFACTAGHRYYIRADCSKFGEFTAGGVNQVHVTSGSQRTLVADNGTGHVVITANGTSIIPEQYTTGSTGAGYSAGTVSHVYMIVDITELEDMVGSTLTAAQVWSYFGSNVWWGTKTIES